MSKEVRTSKGPSDREKHLVEQTDPEVRSKLGIWQWRGSGCLSKVMYLFHGTLIELTDPEKAIEAKRGFKRIILLSCKLIYPRHTLLLFQSRLELNTKCQKVDKDKC